MIGKKLRMRIHNRIEMRKEQLEHLAQRLGSDKNKPNDSQNDNQNDNTEENDHETDKLRRLTAASLVLAFTLPQAHSRRAHGRNRRIRYNINMDY